MDNQRTQPGPAEPAATDQEPVAALAEEAYLDAVADHTEPDEADLEQLRDQVGQWYDSLNPTPRAPHG
jgi:hypothetical protein